MASVRLYGLIAQTARALAVTIMVAPFLAMGAQAQTRLEPLGGSGGSPFEALCPAGKLVNGLDLRVGAYIDAARPICVTAVAPGLAGSELVVGPYSGGPGGHPIRITCPLAQPVVVGMYVLFEGREIATATHIHLFCGVIAEGAQQGQQFPSASFDAAPIQDPPLFAPFNQGGDGAQACSPGQVAVGIHGRAGDWLDAVGLVCAAAPFVKPPVKLGRVQHAGGGPQLSICQRAEDALARKAPTAGALFDLCVASKPPPVVLGRSQPTSPKGPKRTLCQRAKDARARNAPTADALARACVASAKG